MTVLAAMGSVASILGLIVTLYVLWREVSIGREVHDLKSEEEAWHEKR